MTLESAWWGSRQAPTLVLLHEGLGCVALWRDFPARLAEATGCGVFAWSRRGYGQSGPVALPRPLTYMHDEAALLSSMLDEAGVHRAILVGHSDGASIAAIHAGSVYDARVRGLVLIAPHFFTEEMGLRAIGAAREAYDTGDLRARLARYHRDVDNAFRGWNDAWLNPAFRAWRIDEYLPYIRLPILVLQGEDDEYGTPSQVEIVHELAYGPVESLMVPGARHSPHLQAPAIVQDRVAGFVARIRAHESPASVS